MPLITVKKRLSLTRQKKTKQKNNQNVRHTDIGSDIDDDVDFDNHID